MIHVAEGGRTTTTRRRRADDAETMVHKFIASIVFVTQLLVASSANPNSSFVFNGFDGASLELNGGSLIEQSGLLRLTNFTRNEVSHAFYPNSFRFINSSSGSPLSFSSSFVFAIFPQYSDISSQGIAFTISPTNDLSVGLPSQHLGLFNLNNNGDKSNHIVAVELDTIQNKEFNDINDNHVGIDVNGLTSIVSTPASFFLDSSGLEFQNLSLISGEPQRVWVNYDGEKMELNVTLAPMSSPKPHISLLSAKLNLSSIILDEMYVGFSSSTGAAAGAHYILGWSFSINGAAGDELNPSVLPSLHDKEVEYEAHAKKNHVWTIVLPVSISLVILTAVGLAFLLKAMRKFAEVVEDWEQEYGPHRFSYKDLYKATRGFRDENLCGKGGFGAVYKGLLPQGKVEIAVKRISHDSRQGMKEFVAEIASIGRLRHRNLVQLLGYSRRRGELLLVYDFMPNGSLEKYIFGRPEELLEWKLRFKIIRGVAAALLYLHEECTQVVLHRDIKASNVLLDAEFNAKLGDFGLAKLYDHGSNPQTTRVIGTLGYLAPELSRTGKSTPGCDVFGFGVFLLEVACGKRPVELKTSGIDMVLVDWVMGHLRRGEILEARDRKLGGEFVGEEVALVLRLGLLCSHPNPTARPTMRQVVQYLEGEAAVPDLLQDATFFAFPCSPIDGD